MPVNHTATELIFFIGAAAPSTDLLHLVSNKQLAMIVALFVLIMTYFLLLLRREREHRIDPVLAAAGKSKRWIRKKSVELENEGEYKGAGDLLLLLDNFEGAAKMYVQGKALGCAAEAFLKMEDKERAAKAFEKRGLPLRAAWLYREGNKYVESARAFLRAERPLQAAEALEEARQYADAAEIYKRTSHLRKAGEIYYKAGDRLTAAQALEEAFQGEMERLPGDMKPADSRMLAHMAYLIGNFYEQEGKLDEAAAAFEGGGHLAEGARLHEQVGRYPLAAQLYIAAGKPFEASICEEKAGRKEEAALIRAEAYRERGQLLDAVGHYELANRPYEAALMYREIGDHDKAARMYERAGEFGEAATEYEAAGENDLVAAALEKAGEHLRAAEAYKEVGNPSKQARMLEMAEKNIEAGKIYAEAGAVENAIRALQHIVEDDEEFEQAQLLLGDIFREKGIPKIATQYYRRVLTKKRLDRSNIRAYYNLALCVEAVGSLREALETYEAIVVIDYHFEDVADRIRLLEERLPATTPGTPSEPSSTSPYDATLSGDAGATQLAQEGTARSRRYEIIDELGRGGMGIVYKARDTVLDRIVAYKVLPANLREHPQAVKNFFREAKSAAALNHQNIVTVHDAGEEDGNYYIAMELIKGQTIKQMLHEEDRLPMKAVVFITAQILHALAFAHGRKIIHRDIKSSNIMWTEDKTVKLMDFGLAKVVEEFKASQTVASGTPYYMSPEQTLGGIIDHRTDLYSLGVTIFEMVTGRLPFPDGQAAYHHVHTAPPSPREFFPELHPSMVSLIQKLMQKNPDDRYQNADEILDALKEVAGEIK